MRHCHAIAAALMLAGCAVTGQIHTTPPAGSSPVTGAISAIDKATTVCDATTIDETVLSGLWRGFDLYLDWIDDQHLTYGSPKALAELNAERRIKRILESITSVRNACSGGSWAISLAALKLAYADALNALK